MLTLREAIRIRWCAAAAAWALGRIGSPAARLLCPTAATGLDKEEDGERERRTRCRTRCLPAGRCLTAILSPRSRPSPLPICTSAADASNGSARSRGGGQSGPSQLYRDDERACCAFDVSVSFHRHWSEPACITRSTLDRNKVEITSGLPLVASQFGKLYPHIEPPSRWTTARTSGFENGRRRRNDDHL